MDVVEFHPTPDQFAWTFGGAAPTHTIRPGTALRLWTEDAFSGRLQRVTDMPSQVLDMTEVNPQTGPFLVEGAEPGRHPGDPHRRPDARARLGRVHHDPVLRRADRHRPHRAAAGAAARAHLDLPGRPREGHRPVRGAQGAQPGAADRADAGHGGRRAGRARGAHEPGARQVRRQHGLPRDEAPAPPASSASTCRARCSRVGDGHYRQGEGESCGTAVEGAMDVTVDRRPGQGGCSRVAPPGAGRPLRRRRLVAAAGGRVAGQPGRDGRLAGRAVRARRGSTPTSCSPRSA